MFCIFAFSKLFQNMITGPLMSITTYGSALNGGNDLLTLERCTNIWSPVCIFVVLTFTFELHRFLASLIFILYLFRVVWWWFESVMVEWGIHGSFVELKVELVYSLLFHSSSNGILRVLNLEFSSSLCFVLLLLKIVLTRSYWNLLPPHYFWANKV